MLQQILIQMKKLDPTYLDLLHYTKIENNGESIVNGISKHRFFGGGSTIEQVRKTHSALHEAFRDGNNRVVEAIMMYMA